MKKFLITCTCRLLYQEPKVCNKDGTIVESIAILDDGDDDEKKQSFD